MPHAVPTDQAGMKYLRVSPSVMLRGGEWTRAEGIVDREEYEIVIDHHSVPHLTVFESMYMNPEDDSDPKNGTNTWGFHLDDRMIFFLEADDEQLDQVFHLLAHAMAIAAGYTNFGKGSTIYNKWGDHLLESVSDFVFGKPTFTVETERYAQKRKEEQEAVEKLIYPDVSDIEAGNIKRTASLRNERSVKTEAQVEKLLDNLISASKRIQSEDREHYNEVYSAYVQALLS